MVLSPVHAVSCSVFFDQPTQTLDMFLADLRVAAETRVRVFGGHILVLGGTMWLAGCESHRVVPVCSILRSYMTYMNE
jgi:hypothetical protein